MDFTALLPIAERLLMHEQMTASSLYDALCETVPGFEALCTTVSESQTVDTTFFDSLPGGFKPASHEQAELYARLIISFRDATIADETAAQLLDRLTVVHPLIGEYVTAINHAVETNDRTALLALVPQDKRIVAGLAITALRKYRHTKKDKDNAARHCSSTDRSRQA